MAVLHVVPVNDYIDHEYDYEGECACGPTPLMEAGIVYVHHSLDGREEDE